MTQKTASKRRDPRLALPSGAGFVNFEAGEIGDGRYRAELVEVSVAGMTLEFEAGPSFETGTILPNATVSIGECVVEGELFVKHSESIHDSRLEVGCLFYPSSQLDEEKWSAALAGLQAARGA